MNRLFLAGVAAVIGLGAAQAQTPPAGGGAAATPPATTPARTDTPRVAAFNVAMLMKKFDKWQYYAVTMENARVDAAIELLKLRNEIVSMQEAASKETEQAKRDAWVERIREKQYAFEKQEKKAKDQLDADASKHLKELFADVNAVVASVVESNGYDIVFAYPEATTKEEADSQNYIDLKLRATAAMPFYVSKRVDITDVMVRTLNEYRKAPGPIPAKRPMPNPKDMAAVGPAPAPAVQPTGGLTSNPGK